MITTHPPTLADIAAVEVAVAEFNKNKIEEMTSAQKELETFAETTTLHGASRILRAVTWRKRLFWLTLFVSAVLMFSYQFSLLLRKYVAYDKRYSFDVRQDDNAFPWISVCNKRAVDLLPLKQIYDVYDQRNASQAGNDSTKEKFGSFVESVMAKYTRMAAINSRLTQAEQLLAEKLLSASELRHDIESTRYSGMTKIRNFFFKQSARRTQYTSNVMFRSGLYQCTTYDFDAQQADTGFRPSWSATVFDGRRLLPSAERRAQVKTGTRSTECIGNILFELDAYLFDN